MRRSRRVGELLGTRDTYVHFGAGAVRPGGHRTTLAPAGNNNLPSGVVAKEALRRAHTMMMSDPKGAGPYGPSPRETLTELWSEGEIRSYPESRFNPAYAWAPSIGKSVEAIATAAGSGSGRSDHRLRQDWNHASDALLDRRARFAEFASSSSSRSMPACRTIALATAASCRPGDRGRFRPAGR